MTVAEFPLIIQTGYAELIDQLRLATACDFPTGSTFRKRRISGKDYWYVQEPTGPRGRPPERYLGPDCEELKAAIEAGVAAKADVDSRKALIRSLKGAGLPGPDDLTAAIIDALARAGVFRLRVVIVGTVAFQTYAGLLGIKLPGGAIRTGDIDLAQDYGVSIAIDDAVDTPLIDILKTVDDRFAPVPSLAAPHRSASYARPGGYRVDVLTTNRGAERDEPVKLPSLKSDAAPLRFLDFLLKEPVAAAALTRVGALVNTPAPQRYAVHKLIVSTLRAGGENAAKADKDIAQAGLLIEALALKRRGDDLREAFHEAAGRGSRWRRRLETGARRLGGAPREILGGLV